MEKDEMQKVIREQLPGYDEKQSNLFIDMDNEGNPNGIVWLQTAQKSIIEHAL